MYTSQFVIVLDPLPPSINSLPTKTQLVTPSTLTLCKAKILHSICNKTDEKVFAKKLFTKCNTRTFTEKFKRLKKVFLFNNKYLV